MEDDDLVDIEVLENRKDISFFGGVALLVNNITGPGLITIPLVYQQAGWLITTFVFLLVMALSSIAATMLCKAMSKVRGNENFQGTAEFTTVAKHFFPKWGFVITMILFVISLMSFLVSSIVIAAQTMDLALIAIFSKSFSLEVYPNPGIGMADQPSNSVSPFGNSYGLSIGYVIVLALSVPMGFFDLDNNIFIQLGAFVLLFVIFGMWLVNFFLVGLDTSRVPTIGSNFNSVLGTIIFNYAFVSTIPSWVNQKRKEVSINKSVWLSTSLSTLIYIIIGLLGALAFDFDPNGDLLSAINNSSSGVNHTIAQACVYIFPMVALMTSIPVFSIVIRYNLIANKICRKAFANFWGVIFPWLLSLLFYGGSGLLVLINWASLLVNGVVNFILPLVLFIIATRCYHEDYTFYHSEKSINSESKESIQMEQISTPDEECSEEVEVDGSSLVLECETKNPPEKPFEVIPKWVHPIFLAGSLIVIFGTLLLIVIILNILQSTGVLSM